MSVLHIVPLPGIEPGLYRGFSFILEVATAAEYPDEAAFAQWKAFAEESGARGILVMEGELVVIRSPYDERASVPSGPCPFYMQGMGVTHLCGLRAGHDGLCEEVKPGDGPHPPQIATWGDRKRFQESAAGFTSVVMPAPPIDLSAVDLANLKLGACGHGGCERPAFDDFCEAHRTQAQ